MRPRWLLLSWLAAVLLAAAVAWGLVRWADAELREASGEFF